MYQASDLIFCSKSYGIWNTRGSTLPRNGSNFLDSVPHIRQLTSFWRMPPKMAVTTVDAPFLDKPHQRNTVRQKAWAQFPTPVWCSYFPVPGWDHGTGTGCSRQNGHCSCPGAHHTYVVPTLLYVGLKESVNLGGSKQMLNLSVLWCSWVHFYSAVVSDTHTGSGFSPCN